MARIEHLTAIILTRGPLREFDRRVVVYSRQRGKLSLIAKGTQKITSKLAGSLEPLTEVEISVARGRSNRVIGSVARSVWPGLRDDLRRLAAANFLAQVVDELVDLEHPDSRFYETLRRALDDLETAEPTGLGPIVRTCLWRMIDQLGFRPRLDRCVRCGRDLAPQPVYSPSLGGALCEACKTSASDRMPLTPELIDALNRLLEPASPAPVPVRGALDRTIAQFLNATLLVHLGRHLPAERFWRSVNKSLR